MRPQAGRSLFSSRELRTGALRPAAAVTTVQIHLGRCRARILHRAVIFEIDREGSKKGRDAGTEIWCRCNILLNPVVPVAISIHPSDGDGIRCVLSLAIGYD